MSACCPKVPSPSVVPADPFYRRVLWVALVVNAAMFIVELTFGWSAGSASLLADAVDFFGDAGNYAVSLFVLGLAPVWRSRTALAKGVAMGLYGVFVLGTAAWNGITGTVPEAITMGAVGAAALTANLLVAVLLYAYRNGDANMRSVWLCTRNDVIGNLAVLLAAAGVFGTGNSWPDLAVAILMGGMGLAAAWSVTHAALAEVQARQCAA